MMEKKACIIMCYNDTAEYPWLHRDCIHATHANGTLLYTCTRCVWHQNPISTMQHSLVQYTIAKSTKLVQMQLIVTTPLSNWEKDWVSTTRLIAPTFCRRGVVSCVAVQYSRVAIIQLAFMPARQWRHYNSKLTFCWDKFDIVTSFPCSIKGRGFQRI